MAILLHRPLSMRSLFVCSSVHPSVRPSVRLSVCLPIHWPACLKCLSASGWLAGWLTVCLFVGLLPSHAMTDGGPHQSWTADKQTHRQGFRPRAPQQSIPAIVNTSAQVIAACLLQTPVLCAKDKTGAWPSLALCTALVFEAEGRPTVARLKKT